MNRTERRKRDNRDRILQSAFDLFLTHGVAATTIDEICDHADVACRTFFNHFPTRQAMIAALAQQWLADLPNLSVTRAAEPIPARITVIFDGIAAALVKSGDTDREMIGEMMAAAGRGTHRGLALHDAFVDMVKEGVARGEVTARHDPLTLADIIVSTLSGAIGNWTVGQTSWQATDLHNSARALADLLSLDVDTAPRRRRRP